MGFKGSFKGSIGVPLSFKGSIRVPLKSTIGVQGLTGLGVGSGV